MHFSVRRLFITTIAVLVLVSATFILTFFRLLDEILFFKYRQTKISRPVFIIGNPRSGTTFMHRLISLDEGRYAYMKLYHTILPSVTFYKIVKAISFVDRRIGRPFRRFFDWIDSWLFKKWRHIHPTGFNQTDEDEGLFIFSFLTVAVSLICPYMQHLEYLTIIDRLPETTRTKLQNYFMSSLKRFMYVEGQNKILLTKNVITTGRLNTILSAMPDARVVYLVRDPRAAIPSYISMFSSSWKLIAPGISETGKEYQALAKVAIDFYKYFYTQKQKYTSYNFITIGYTEAKENPAEVINRIYNYFGLPVSNAFIKQLEKSVRQTKNYKSLHKYSLAQYGLTAAAIENELKEFMNTYFFDEAAA